MDSKKPEVVGSGDGDKPFKLDLNFKLPRRFTVVAGAFFALLIGVFVFFNMCFTYVRPNELGIKQVNIGILSSRGIQTKIYGPGMAFRIPTFEMIHRFPAQLQVLELSDTPSGVRLPGYSRDSAAKIQTSDGFFVDVDVTILYRIVDPYKLITTLGPGQQYLHQGIIPKAKPILKQALGELTTEDFYNSPMRVSKAEKARDMLNAELQPKGMQVDHVLVRYFSYSPEIQKNIEEKKLKDQLVFKNQAQARAAVEEANVKRVTQEGEAAVSVTRELGRAYKVRKDAERDLYTRSRRAEADLLVKLAEAKRVELRNEAMQAVGVEKAVALKMAEVLKGLDVIVIPTGGEGGMNPLDLDRMITMFGLGTRTQGTVHSADGAKASKGPRPGGGNGADRSVASIQREEVAP